MDETANTEPQRRRGGQPGGRRPDTIENQEFDWTQLDPRTRDWLAMGCPAIRFNSGRPANISRPLPQAA